MYQLSGIYIFHIWSFCAGRKTSTIGLFELFIIIICWIFCTYTQILSRNLEDFCVHAQKFLIMILDNKVFQHWIICAYTQILNRDVEDFCVHAQKFLIMISDNNVFQRWIICAYTQILNRNVVRRIHPCVYVLGHMHKNSSIGRQLIIRNICVRAQNTSMSL